MCSVKFAVAVVAVAILLAYSFYHPLPDGICEPRSRVLKLHVLSQINKHVATIGSWLQLGTKYQLTRRIQSSMGFAFDPDILTDPEITITDMLIKNVSVRVYHPRAAFSSEDIDYVPAVIYFHGGGWTVGSVAFYHHFTRELARLTNFVVISVDYSLAPEHRYPAAFDDCLLVTEHVLQHGHQLRIDTQRVALMGDSAGGNLAAAVALKLTNANQKDLSKLKAQLLIYPVVQAYDFKTPSFLIDSPLILSAYNMVAFWSNYLDSPFRDIPHLLDNNHTSPLFKKSVFAGYMNHTHIIQHADYHVPKAYKKPESQDYGDLRMFNDLIDKGLLDPYAMPLAANSLEGVPDAYVFTAEFDILRDEGVAYVNRLRSAGVEVVHRHARNGFHGIMLCISGSLIELPSADIAFQDMIAYLTRKLA